MLLSFATFQRFETKVRSPQLITEVMDSAMHKLSAVWGQRFSCEQSICVQDDGPDF